MPMPTVKQKAKSKIIKVLHCTCGACVHWEIITKGARQFIKCMTCSDVFPIRGLKVPRHDKLKWIERNAV